MRRIIATAIGASALMAVPAVTLAAGSHSAKPVPNGNYCINCTAKKLPGSFHVSTNSKEIDHWDYFNNCVPVPVPKMPAMKISAKETFHFKGTLTAVTGKKYQFSVTGHFVTSHLIEGVIDATGGGRTCKAVAYKAKFTRTGPFQG